MKNQRGQALVEMALILPFLLMLVVGIVGAAWPCLEYCPVCSQMFPGSIALRRAVLGLARALAVAL